MGATNTGGYRCCCDSDNPSFVLSLCVGFYGGIGEMPEFKLQMTASSNGIEETLCGYTARNMDDHFEGRSFLNFGAFKRIRSYFYRLVYRHGKNGSGGTFPPASSARPHQDDVIEGTVDAEREERRLMATEESRQRYGLRPC